FDALGRRTRGSWGGEMIGEEGRVTRRGLPASRAVEPPTAQRRALALQAIVRRYHWAMALVAYLLVSLILTFPLLFHLGDRITGPWAEGDDKWYVWYLWWFRRALLSANDPAYTHLMFALGPRVQLFAASTLNGLAGTVLQTVMSPLAAYNVLCLLSF